MNRFEQHLSLWTEAIRTSATPELAETLLGVFAAQTTEWPLALTDIESLSDWTHAGLMAHAMAATAPPGVAPEAAPETGTCTASFLKTIREIQLIGKLALACEQALHLGDHTTAVQMMRLMKREWLQMRGELALREALECVGGSEGPEA